jgi:hypothetical protein
MRSPDLENRCEYPCYADNEKNICIFECDELFSEYDGKCVSNCIDKYPNEDGVCEGACMNNNGSCNIECSINSILDEDSKSCVFECEKDNPDIYGRCEIPCFSSFGKESCTINCGKGFVVINRRCVYGCTMNSPSEEGLCEDLCIRRGSFCTSVSMIFYLLFFFFFFFEIMYFINQECIYSRVNENECYLEKIIVDLSGQDNITCGNESYPCRKYYLLIFLFYLQ